MSPGLPNLWSQNGTESTWKWGTAIVFIAASLALYYISSNKTLLLAVFPEWPESLDIPHQAVMLVSLVSFLIFQVLHHYDGKNACIRGLRGRLKVERPDRGDYVSSAISRVSMQAALGAAAVGAINTLAVKDCPARFALGMLGLATMLAMVSILCYAHASRWTDTSSDKSLPGKKPRIRKDLLDKATALDQFSWYALTTGLIWSIALVSPAVAILANGGLGLLLWGYYFEFVSINDRDATQALPDCAAPTDPSPNPQAEVTPAAPLDKEAG